MRCGAESHTRDGRPCRRWVQVGSLRCNLHSGAAPQAIRKGDERATIAQLMQHEDPDAPRPVGEAMLDAFNTADVLHRSLRDGRLRVARGETVTDEELDRLIRMSQVVVHLGEQLARTGVHAALLERERERWEVSRDASYAVINRVLEALLDGLGLAVRPAPFDATPEEVDARRADLPLRVAWRDWTREVVTAEVDAVEAAPSLDDYLATTVEHPPPPPSPCPPASRALPPPEENG